MRLSVRLVCSGVRRMYGRIRSYAARTSASDIEAEMNDVAVGDGVFLAFEARLTGLLALRLAAVADEIVVGDDLGADESLLDVAVDLAGGLLRDGAAPDRPGADLVFARGQEAHQVEQPVGGLHEAVARRSVETGVAQERRLILGRQLGDLTLEPPRHRQAFAAALPYEQGELRRQRLGGILVRAVEDHEQLRQRNQLIAGEQLGLFGSDLDRTQRLAFTERGHQPLEQRVLAIFLAFPIESLESFVEHGEIAEREFLVETRELGLGLRRRSRIGIGKSAYDRDHRVGVLELGHE